MLTIRRLRLVSRLGGPTGTIIGGRPVLVDCAIGIRTGTLTQNIVVAGGRHSDAP